MEKEAKAMSQANAEIVEPKAEDYAPYHLYPAFREGFIAYGGISDCPYDPSSVACQAWDRGMEYASRLNLWRLRQYELYGLPTLRT
jgi:hypothetical protein